MRGLLWRARVPAVAEIDFEPGAEIHWRRVGRHADVAEVAGAIARRHVHRAAERSGQMSEVAADADPLALSIGGRAARICRAIVEMDASMHIVADRLNQPRPAADAAELRPCEIA